MNTDTDISNNQAKGANVEDIDLLQIIGLLLDHWKLLAFTTGFAVAVSLIYNSTTSPIYLAGGLLQVEEKTASLPGLEDLADAFASESSTETEIAIIRSRSVLGATVDDLSLTTTVRPKFFPLIGRAMHSVFVADGREETAPPPFGLGSYAWGGEKLILDSLAVKNELINKPLVLTRTSDSTFTIHDEEGSLLLGGEFGKEATSEDVSVVVTDIAGRTGVQFVLVKKSRMKTVQELQQNLTVEEIGRNTGIIRLAYRNTSPARAERVINSVSSNYVKQNISRLSAEAESSLKFISDQIPSIKTDLEQAETDLNEYASENNSIDVTVENEAVLTQAVELDTRIQELELQLLELNRRFTEQHPNVTAAKQQLAALNNEKSFLERRIRSLPDTQQRLISLRRSVDVAGGMYELLLYKAQEMEVAKASTVGNVRIIDPALADIDSPVAPSKFLNLALGFMIGLMIGLAIIILKKIMYRGITAADDIEALDVTVFASVPFSEEQKRWDDSFNMRLRAHKAKRHLKILSKEEPTDLSVEMLRNLRTSLYFNLAEARNKSIMITGPSPGVGKSFISVNLASVCALAGQRVLLVDADMRRGYLHRYVKKDSVDGLADYLSGKRTISEAIAPTEVENLDCITRGSTPPNPSELLHHDRLAELIGYADKNYDLVIFDTPPVLAVTDAAIIGNQVGNVLLICRFDTTTQREITHATTRLTRDGAQVTGAVLNGIEKRLSNYYGYGGYYGYGYGYKYKSDHT